MRNVFRLLRTPIDRARQINCLPPDVLSVIFRLTTGPEKAPSLRDDILLSSVCQSWRVITLRNGVMWSNIRLTGQDPSIVAQQLERCRVVSGSGQLQTGRRDSGSRVEPSPEHYDRGRRPSRIPAGVWLRLAQSERILLDRRVSILNRGA